MENGEIIPKKEFEIKKTEGMREVILPDGSKMYLPPKNKGGRPKKYKTLQKPEGVSWSEWEEIKKLQENRVERTAYNTVAAIIPKEYVEVGGDGVPRDQKEDFEKEVGAGLKRIIRTSFTQLEEQLEKKGNSAAQLSTVLGIALDKQQSLDVNRSLSRDKEITGILKVMDEEITIDIARRIFSSPDLKGVGQILEDIVKKREEKKNKNTK